MTKDDIESLLFTNNGPLGDGVGMRARSMAGDIFYVLHCEDDVLISPHQDADTATDETVYVTKRRGRDEG